MPASEAMKRATTKYIREKLDEIKIRPPKGTKDRWKSYADSKGLSLQKFIITSVEAAIASENEGTAE